jgi:methionyl-tRNA synthetase
VRKRVLITSALPYANGPLHFGHIAGAYLPADCYARFERLMGSDVLYVCGSDEDGVAITLSAEKQGRTPEEHTEINHKLIQDFFSKMGIAFDHYSRTTNRFHAPIVQSFFSELQKGGYIDEKEAPQLYDEKNKRFMADRYVVGTCPKCGYDQARGDECGKCGASYEATDLLNPRSKLSDAPLSIRNTRHWYLRFDLFKEELHAFLEKKDWKPNVTNFAKQYIDDLRERAITRDLKWGVPVNAENAEGKVFYVWFDAPIGYISATQEWADKKGDPEAWKTYWQSPDTHFVQFLGKDNIPFHALFFPAMMMG